MCHGPCVGLERNFQTRGKMREERTLLEWEMQLEQWSAQGRAERFCRPATNFYSLKTETSYWNGGIR